MQKRFFERFQSTCPARGTTDAAYEPQTPDQISIHVPREGHDFMSSTQSLEIELFQSTCPARGTTHLEVHQDNQQEFQSTCPARGTTLTPEETSLTVTSISIHVPREGHDKLPPALAGSSLNFNPRAPRGARLFLRYGGRHGAAISIHVPREGHDASRCSSLSTFRAFQSTCPARGTTHFCVLPRIRTRFQSTCPARGTTAPCCRARCWPPS